MIISEVAGNLLNILKTELYALKRQILQHVNYIQLFFQKN